MEPSRATIKRTVRCTLAGMECIADTGQQHASPSARANGSCFFARPIWSAAVRLADSGEERVLRRRGQRAPSRAQSRRPLGYAWMVHMY